MDLASCSGCDVTGGFANKDESILNLGLGSAVRYGDRVYDTIGVDTNGYLVVGGGTCCGQRMLHASRTCQIQHSPNNVIAPYWTDLNFTTGGNMYVGLVQLRWHPLRVRVRVEERADLRHHCTLGHSRCGCTRTRASTGSHPATPVDNNEIVYGTAVAGDAGTPLNIGAEDALGLTAAQLGPDNTGTVAPDADGYYVVTGASAPGGDLTIDYDVLGKHVGTSNLRALMDSDQTVGTAKVITPFTVTHSPSPRRKSEGPRRKPGASPFVSTYAVLLSGASCREPFSCRYCSLWRSSAG